MNSIDSPVNRHMRKLMPVSNSLAYFDHAAVAPLPQPTHQAISQWLDEATTQGDLCWPRWAKRVEAIRRSAAKLIGADSDEIAFVPNTSAGVNYVAEGFPWIAGDNIVTLGNEFPANLYPWMNLKTRGVETLTVPVNHGIPNLQRILDTCNDRTKLLSISWVSFSSGYRFTTRELETIIQQAHDRGILVMLDAIQGLGVFPLNVESLGIDFMAADGHKWMLGPEGAGIFYLRKEHLNLLRPVMVGWHSVANPFDFSNIHWEPRLQAARYEGGTQNMAGVLGYGASLEMLQQLGVSKDNSPIAEQILSFTRAAQQQLIAVGAEIFGPSDSEHQSGITSFAIPGIDLGLLRQQCLDAGIILSHRDGRLRISPHAYNKQDDLDRLLTVIERARA